MSAAAQGNGVISSLSPLRGARTSDSISNFTSVAATGGFAPNLPVSSATMQIAAGCAPAAQLAGAISKTVQITTGSQAVVKCPAGMKAFGGGGHYVTADNHYSIGVPTSGT